MSETDKTLPFDQEKKLAEMVESETIQDMKLVALSALSLTLACTGHALDTSELIKARFSRQLEMSIITFFNQKHSCDAL